MICFLSVHAGPGSEAPALLLEPKQGSNTLSSPGSGSRCPARRDAKHSASSTPKVVKPKPLTYLAPSTESEGTLSQTDTPNTQNTCSSLGSSISKPSSYSHFSSSNSGPTGSSMLSEGPSHATMVMQRINKLQATNSNVQDCSPSSAKTSGPLWHSPGTPSTMGRQRTPSRNNAVAEHSGRQSTVLPPVPRTDSNRSAVDLDQPHRSQCIGTYDRQPQQQQQQYTTQPVNGNAHNAMPAVCAASPPPATLLYCFPDAPEAMHRGSWSLDDYGLLERIHKGRSSAVFKVGVHKLHANNTHHSSSTIHQRLSRFQSRQGKASWCAYMPWLSSQPLLWHSKNAPCLVHAVCIQHALPVSSP